MLSVPTLIDASEETVTSDVRTNVEGDGLMAKSSPSGDNAA